ncbi:MAG: STM3941 family protein [Bacteroidota bacterium]
MKDRIEIQLSKTKILILLVGSIVFVVLGGLFLLSPEKFESPIFRNPAAIRVVGIASAAFFGICSIFITRKLFNNGIGLQIDDDGIIDNSNSTSIGLIEWADISGIRTIQVGSAKILLLETIRPEKYIERAKNGISKQAMKANHKKYGTPLSVVSDSLRIKHADLEKLVREELAKQKR